MAYFSFTADGHHPIVTHLIFKKIDSRSHEMIGRQEIQIKNTDLEIDNVTLKKPKLTSYTQRRIQYILIAFKFSDGKTKKTLLESTIPGTSLLTLPTFYDIEQYQRACDDSDDENEDDNETILSERSLPRSHYGWHDTYLQTRKRSSSTQSAQTQRSDTDIL
ncbi:hypothetical protein EBQ93_02405 [bacterium]|nr:hypothetical protein [bacterium]